MKMMLKVSVLAASMFFMLVADIPILPLKLVPDAEAILGVRHRTRRRTAVVVGSATAAMATTEAAAANQQAAAAPQQTTAAPQPAAATQPAPAPAPAPAAAAGHRLAVGTVVTTLPAGCTQQAVGGVEYQVCGGNYYRAAFQGNNLVYVVQNPQ